MRLYPAIDIKDGQCVRLKKGLFNEVTVYSDTPYKIAEIRILSVRRLTVLVRNTSLWELMQRTVMLL